MTVDLFHRVVAEPVAGGARGGGAGGGGARGGGAGGGRARGVVEVLVVGADEDAFPPASHASFAALCFFLHAISANMSMS